ncbi:MAG TPA: sulfatase [Tepidisphaeraceae bacterium]|nr:sulfatase [Tepidisphaeraceae bacterium]
MKCIMVMFDSLNRHLLPPYGCDWTHAPNFARLAQRTVTFDKSYVCSMPCMPARRELHTARPNFLHCPWGPLEPFDDSTIEILKQNKVYTHLASDHYHYWEDGGSTYHTRYNTWEFFRGQEGDPWIGQVKDPNIPPVVKAHKASLWRQDWINRQFMQGEAKHSQTRTFDSGIDFLNRNHQEDNWFLQIECFDPHEPFFSPEEFKKLYPHDYKGPHFDWPAYREVCEKPDEVEHARFEYASLLSLCDKSLGRVLDVMDKYDMWKDTMLVVWTDHGFMLGERGCWAKLWMGWYEQTAHTPFFIWDPRSKITNQRRDALIQPALDLGPTLLNFFGIEPTKDMQGQNLRPAIESNKPLRDAALFGHFGDSVNVTDGRYVYMRKPVFENDGPLNQYTLMPNIMRGFKSLDLLRHAELADHPFTFTKGIRTLRLPVAPPSNSRKTNPNHELYDLDGDPQQENSLSDPALERRMIDLLTSQMKSYDAPPEQFNRLGL